MRIFAILAALSIAHPALAAERTRLDGEAMQGGLLTGRTIPSAKLMLDGRPVRVGVQGNFVVGFGRDAAKMSELVVRHRDGAEEKLRFSVGQRQYDIQRIDGVAPRFVAPPPEVADRIARERKAVGAARRGFRDVAHFLQDFQWPVTGPITGVYGSQRIFNGEPRAPHGGVDIAAAEGTPVVAPAAGRVVLGGDLYFSGNTVILDHGHGVFSTYLHMSVLEVEDGQEVAQGESIGRVGATGRVTGPHLHWGLNWYNVRLDPQLLMGPMPSID